MTYKLNLWFPGLEAEKPARILWTAGSADQALQQVRQNNPDCKVELCD